MLVDPLCCNDDRAGEIGPTFHFMTRHDLVLANDRKKVPTVSPRGVSCLYAFGLGAQRAIVAVAGVTTIETLKPALSLPRLLW